MSDLQQRSSIDGRLADFEAASARMENGMDSDMASGSSTPGVSEGAEGAEGAIPEIELIIRASTIDGRRKGACLFCQVFNKSDLSGKKI
jgi:hypothetical protein